MSTYNYEAALSESVATAIASGRDEGWAVFVATEDPFAGDFGDGSERTFEDRLVVAKRGGPCRGMVGTCEHGVRKGEIARVVRKVDGDGFYGGRICIRCLDALYAEWKADVDNDDPETE